MYYMALNVFLFLDGELKKRLREISQERFINCQEDNLGLKIALL